MSPTKILTTILVLVTIANTKLIAQCRTPLPAVPCTGTEPLVLADEIITQGVTKYYYGPTVSINSLTLRGGTLIVCGDLTIDKFYMDSGQIIVNPLARFVIGSGLGSGLILQGNCAITNYGTLECQRNLTLENGWATVAKPNVVINETPFSVFKMPNQYFVINNAHSWFVNKGYAQFWGLITDNQASPGSVCLSRSVTHMAILINKVANAYIVPSGNACLYVHQSSQFFGVLTSAPSLFACLSASHISDAGCIPFGCLPNNWGTAQVVTNCSNCASLNVLPVHFISFAVHTNDDRNVLQWQLNASTSEHVFYVERSADGRNFYVIDSVTPGQSTMFSYIDAFAPSGINHYRIKCVEKHSGLPVMSKIVSATKQGVAMRVYPSPFVQDFYIELSPGELLKNIIVRDITGKNIPVRYQQARHHWRVTLMGNLSKQALIVQVVTGSGMEVRKIMKE